MTPPGMWTTSGNSDPFAAEAKYHEKGLPQIAKSVRETSSGVEHLTKALDELLAFLLGSISFRFDVDRSPHADVENIWRVSLRWSDPAVDSNHDRTGREPVLHAARPQPFSNCFPLDDVRDRRVRFELMLTGVLSEEGVEACVARSKRRSVVLPAERPNERRHGAALAGRGSALRSRPRARSRTQRPNRPAGHRRA